MSSWLSISSKLKILDLSLPALLLSKIYTFENFHFRKINKERDNEKYNIYFFVILNQYVFEK